MIEKYISRWAAFGASWLAALVAGFVVLKAKTWFGLDLNTVEVTGLLLGVLLPLGGAVTAWVHNRGRYEIAKLAGQTGLTPEQVNAITGEVLKNLPTPPPTAGTPIRPADGAPAAANAPPGQPGPLSPGPGGTTPGQ